MAGSGTGSGERGLLRVRYLFGAVAVGALVLGYVGLRQHLRHDAAVIDLAYWDLQLFVLGSEPASGPGVPLALAVARLLAPAATGFALLTTVREVLGERARRARLARARRFRGHSVVAGVTPATAYLARRLAAEGRSVVLVDPDPAGAAAELDRSPAVVHVVGDPRVPEVLAQAGVAGAHEVMALTPDSAFNAEVALAARQVALSSPAATVYAQVDDHDICAEMAARALSFGAGPSRVEFFSRHDRAARRLLDDHPVPPGDGAAMLVVGSGPLAQALVVEVARRRSRVATACPPLPLRLVDERAPAGLAARLRVPAQVVGLRAEALDLAAVQRADDLAVGVGDAARPPTHVFVCLPDEASGIRAGLHLARLLGPAGAEVVVAAATSAVLGKVLDAGAPGAGRRHPFVLHNINETVYTPEAVRRGDLEDIARSAHEAYLATGEARGETRATNPSLVPWDELPQRLRDDNRAQAEDIGPKLASIGAAVVPATGHDAPFAFTDDEVERLAIAEHERWLARRLARGWRPGERDDDAKRHPGVVPWEVLPDDLRAKDRDAVRSIPAHLAGAGLAIVRGAG